MSASKKLRSTINLYLSHILLMAALALPFSAGAADLASFCERLPRPAYAGLEKHQASTEWFEVYQVAPGIWAIYEPFQWQEVISYLIVGSDSALLFDTGNGMGDIKAVVDQLTELPLQVLNSHSHFDHVGGNYQFDTILSPSTPFSVANSRGSDSAQIKTEASAEALCHGLPAGVSAENHRLRPYRITAKVNNGDIIELGGRQLQVLLIPGHTDDSVALLDTAAGFLWTGDSFYEGPIWLFFPETDLAAYQKSLGELAAFSPQLNALFPAHNTPTADPAKLLEAQRALAQVFAGQAKAVPTWEGAVTFEFEGFGFLMREDYTTVE